MMKRPFLNFIKTTPNDNLNLVSSIWPLKT